jgi:alpha-tubulin suppressor-like RCC1 family protein
MRVAWCAAVVVGACVPPIEYASDAGADAVDASSSTDVVVGNETQRDAEAGSLPQAEPKATIAAGNTGTCIVEGGTVTCWGQNHGFMLGTTVPAYEWQAPTKLALSGIDDIALGHQHACALVRRPARLRCWGTVPGGVGQTEIPQDIVLPQALIDAGIDYVSLGRSHSCVLSMGASPSRVWCWGKNDHGQVGAGPAASSQPTAVEGLASATRLSAGDDHSCAVMETGSIKCWGRSDFFQAGTNRDDAGNVITPTEIPPPAGDRFVEVRAGDSAERYPGYPGYTCARTAQKKVYCWGSDAGGRLAQNGPLPVPQCDRTPRGLPDAAGHEVRGVCMQPVAITGVLDAVELRAGGGHACFRRENGSILCWGHNGGGQVGAGFRGDAIDRPTPVRGPDGGSQFAAGGPMDLGQFHTCTRNGTDVWCWGIGKFDGPDAATLNDFPIRMRLP